MELQVACTLQHVFFAFRNLLYLFTVIFSFAPLPPLLTFFLLFPRQLFLSLFLLFAYLVFISLVYFFSFSSFLSISVSLPLFGVSDCHPGSDQGSNPCGANNCEAVFGVSHLFVIARLAWTKKPNFLFPFSFFLSLFHFLFPFFFPFLFHPSSCFFLFLLSFTFQSLLFFFSFHPTTITISPLTITMKLDANDILQ